MYRPLSPSEEADAREEARMRAESLEDLKEEQRIQAIFDREALACGLSTSSINEYAECGEYRVDEKDREFYGWER